MLALLEQNAMLEESHVWRRPEGSPKRTAAKGCVKVGGLV
jgi:hypothetical protein